jgi:twitching motility protein PilT
MAFDLDSALAEALSLDASDLHLKQDAVPRVRLAGELVPLEGWEPLGKDDVRHVQDQVIRSELKKLQFTERGSADVSYFASESRFRVTAFRTQGHSSFVFRTIPNAPEPAGLGLPDVALTWADIQRGLIVVCGPTGSGKSTTSAAVLRMINERRNCHIVTIEDPIEFLHEDDRALISQREIGQDTPNNVEAIRAALRQDPDVILIGEVRDEDTAMTALRAAETGHLVICTLHTSGAGATVQRFLDLFGDRNVDLARQMLAATLVGIISQRLIPSSDGGRRLNSEVLVNSSRVRDMIANGEKVPAIQQAVAEGEYYGMQTFHQDLVRLVVEGAIDEDDALAYATNSHDFKLLLAGATGKDAGGMLVPESSAGAANNEATAVQRRMATARRA